jgi:hypothetical protein
VVQQADNDHDVAFIRLSVEFLAIVHGKWREMISNISCRMLTASPMTDSTGLLVVLVSEITSYSFYFLCISHCLSLSWVAL